MARKMYYTEEEAAAKLGCSVDELGQFVTEERIRVFKDGLRNVYTAEEVDALAAERGIVSEEPEEIELAPAEPAESVEAAEPAEIELSAVDEEIELTPADTEKDEISLSALAEEPAPAAPKEDTVLSAEGASIFDEGDFEVEGADPMAKTQVAPSLDEQIAMEGVGSGSGLLDLTRESDDTSLGAEILEHIDADGAEAPPVEELLGEQLGLEAGPAAAPQAATQPTFVEAADPMSGLFTGIAAGAAIVVFVVAGVALAVLGGYTPGYLDWLGENMLAMLLGSIAVIGLGALVGFLVSKSIADRQAAIRRAGG
jgi:hypothetical protein